MEMPQVRPGTAKAHADVHGSSFWVTWAKSGGKHGQCVRFGGPATRVSRAFFRTDVYAIEQMAAFGLIGTLLITITMPFQVRHARVVIEVLRPKGE